MFECTGGTLRCSLYWSSCIAGHGLVLVCTSRLDVQQSYVAVLSAEVRCTDVMTQRNLLRSCAKAYASAGVFIPSAWCGRLEADPVADDATGVLQGLEAMAVNALLLQRSDHALHHPVLLRAVRRDELLAQAVASNQSGVAATGEDQPVVHPEQ